ncbi:MAG: penicillin-binding protein 1C [Bacteroidales bacterium]|nr:penicillin-binding protein 1C [Bacteroidales bacterium]
MSFKAYIRQHKTATTLVAVCVVLLLCWLFCLPRNIFRDTEYSSVVLDRNGDLLGARIASDGQWRFPPCESVPDRYASALIEFEDRHFRWHPGVDPMALGRAVWQNVSKKRVVSGGSTITMQVIRMSRGKDRTIGQKIIEAILATRLELRCSKKEILALYASHAPYGGNVVGIEAASWRYFGRSPEDMSWSEACLLAVLPNSPSSLHMSKNRDKLLEKRNRLLKRLYDKGRMSTEDYELACEEPLPGEPMPLPSYASHYVEMMACGNKRLKTTLDLGIQKQVEEITDRWCHEFSLSGVNDMAAVVIDVHSGEFLAWVGNADIDRRRPGVMVNTAMAPRSTGSILKPFLYCAMLQDGEMLPNTLLHDTPLNINGFTPQNFDMQYSGAVPAGEALARSLNIPSVLMLQKYGVQKFGDLLRKGGMTSLRRADGDYGLSLILGGAEGRLAEIAKIYANMSEWYQQDQKSIKSDPGLKARFKDFPFYDRTAMWHTFEALKEVNRPDEMDWKIIHSVRKVAWKTGTSWGFRDGWAIGATPEYVVGVWCGNAQGQGANGLVGGRTAGPVMFDIFNSLPKTGWFPEPPYGEYITAEVCRKSGHLKGLYCEECDTLKLPLNALRTSPCPYHKIVNLTDGGRYRVESPVNGSYAQSMFLLPPSMEWYYRQRHNDYVPLPPLKPGTPQNGNFIPMEFIYPHSGTSISIPRQLDGSVVGAVFSLAHTNPDTEVHWHLDQKYIGSTSHLHQMTLNPEHGRHYLTVVDAEGNSISIYFDVE